MDQNGKRFVNEALYGAAIGEAIVERAQGKAYLIIDQTLVKKAAVSSVEERLIGFKPRPLYSIFGLAPKAAWTSNPLPVTYRLMPTNWSNRSLTTTHNKAARSAAR